MELFAALAAKNRLVQALRLPKTKAKKFGILPDSENEQKKHDKLKRFPKHEVDCCFADSG